jgi:hypothetical protein
MTRSTHALLSNRFSRLAAVGALALCPLLAHAQALAITEAAPAVKALSRPAKGYAANAAATPVATVAQAPQYAIGPGGALVSLDSSGQPTGVMPSFPNGRPWKVYWIGVQAKAASQSTSDAWDRLALRLGGHAVSGQLSPYVAVTPGLSMGGQDALDAMAKKGQAREIGRGQSVPQLSDDGISSPMARFDVHGDAAEGGPQKVSDDSAKANSKGKDDSDGDSASDDKKSKVTSSWDAVTAAVRLSANFGPDGAATYLWHVSDSEIGANNDGQIDLRAGQMLWVGFYSDSDNSFTLIGFDTSGSLKAPKKPTATDD